ncbi:unnamed protein product [Ectocarpus fasciculatus]
MPPPLPPPSGAPHDRTKSMVEASTNTSLFWGAPLLPQAAAAAAPAPAGGPPSPTDAAVLATQTAVHVPEAGRRHRAGNRRGGERERERGGGGGGGGGRGGGEGEENTVAPLPSNRRSANPTPPSTAHDAGAAVRHGWTTQRGRRRRRRVGAGEQRQHRQGGDAGGESDSSGDDDAGYGNASAAWSRSSSDVDVGESTSLGLLRVPPPPPPPPGDLGSGPGANSAARLNSSSVSSAGSAPRVDETASEDDKASGTTEEGQQAVVVVVTPERNGDYCDGGRGRQPLLGKRGGEGGGGWGVPIVPAAGLMVVPRIEFGQMTDDEMGSDLDEGETIGRIESKYLQGGGSAAPFLRC